MTIERLTIERLTGNDVMELDCDVSGTSMQVACLLLLEGASPVDLSAVRDALAERIVGVARLRRRLLSGGFGSGRPVWVDDAAFDIDRHVELTHCAAPGDEGAMFDAVADAVTRRLPPDRPLWSATVIAGLANGRTGLLLVFHHALSDGIGGLAVLERLMDGVVTEVDPEFPRGLPRYRELAVDALGYRMRALRKLPSGLLSMRRAITELGGTGAPPAPACSLNEPITARRALTGCGVDLAWVKTAAHQQGGTVNDLILTAVAGALHAVLARRGENVDRLVISVPVSARRPADPRRAGNQVGVIPMTIPTTGAPSDRLAAVAAITRGRKSVTPGASAALLGTAFRVLAKLRIFGWFINHQHQVNTYVSDLPGPTREFTFLGRRVVDLIAVPMITGNISVAFAALSYAGRLRISILADPQHCPDLPALTAALHSELLLLTALHDRVVGSGSITCSGGQ